MNKSDQGDPQEPHVGIFWLLDSGRLILDVTPLSKAVPYGDSLTHPRGHLDRWEEMQTNGEAPRYAEYEEYPRGRVVYHQKTKLFTLLADKCIFARPGAIQEIVKTMHLPSKRTEMDRDSHYRCFECLSRSLDL